MTELAEATTAVTADSPELRDLIDHIAEGAIGREQRGEFPFEAIEAVRRARLGALRLPVELGGGGATLVELYEVFIELAAADSNVAHILRSHFGVVENLLRSTDPNQRRWLRQVAAGELIGSAATELSAKAGATDSPHLTTVSRTPGGLRLNGTKHYTTGSLYMDRIIVGVTDVDGGRAQVVVEGDRAGVRRDNDWDGFGQRFTGSGTVTLTDVVIEPEDYFSTGNETSADLDTLPWRATYFHIQLSAMIAGILRRVARDAADHVRGKSRTFYHAPSDTPVEDPIFQYSVGLLASQAYAAEALVLAAGRALEQAYAAHGGPDEYELSLRATLANAKAKVVLDELANRASSELFDVGGGSMVRSPLQLDRHWRNIRAIAAHNPKTLKAVAVGDYELNGTPPPNQGFF